MAILTGGTIGPMACRARPLPCDARVAGTVNGANTNITVVTNDQRMLAILVSALVAGRRVDLEYGEKVEYYWDAEASPPVWLIGHLLTRVTLA